MFTIKPNVNVREYLQKGDREALRESQQRREELQKLAILNTGEDVNVQISGDKAYADIASKKTKYGFTDRVVINVRLEIPDQVKTSLDEKTWDKMVQKTDLYHELAHVKYSDWPSFEEQLENVTDEHKPMFKKWWNAIEDAAVERILFNDLDVEDDFKVVNENLFRINTPDKNVTLNEATAMWLQDKIYPIGWIDKLLDQNDGTHEFVTDQDEKIFRQDVLPILEAQVPDIISEPDPVDRNEMVYELYEDVGVYFDEDAIAPGHDIDFDFSPPDDVDESESMSTGQSPNADPDDLDMDVGEMEQGMDMDVQQDYKQDIEEEEDQLDQEEKMESIEEWGRIIDQEYEEGVQLSLRVAEDPPDDGSFDSSTYQEAQQIAGPLEKELRTRLRQQQKTQKQSKKKSGKVDASRAHKASQGETNIFSRHSDPGDKNYSCMLVLDRSGSMTKEIEDAEKAIGALAIALENIGVEVGQVSVGGNEVVLEKDFAEDVAEARKKMFRGFNSGGTPLSDALALARARLSVAGDNPFMIAVTDGEPDHRERYRDHLHQCDFPVLGVYIKDSDNFHEAHMNESQYYHKLELRTISEIVEGLRHLTKSVMF